MHRRTMLLAVLGTLGASALRAGEVLEQPARMSALASQRLITGIARTGERLVAVGQRGHVVLSRDGGRSWTQALVPVRSDLTAVSFVDDTTGYITGHDGVVLGTRDGGNSWTRLLDGRQVNALVLEHMKRRVATSDASEADRKLLDEAQRNADAGPDKPFLDLCFVNANEGFVVGAYGLVMRTADGGKTWEPWFDRVDNPGLLNLYAIRAAGGAVYIAGEGGLLLKLDAGAQRFTALPSPYKGSLFGLVATKTAILTFGMRGHAFISTDGGTAWSPVDTQLAASIVGAAVAANGTLALADQGGGIAFSIDGGLSFTRSPIGSQAPLAAIAFASTSSLVLGGPRGLRTLDLITKDK